MKKFLKNTSIFILAMYSIVACNEKQQTRENQELSPKVLDTITNDPPFERLKVTYKIDSLKSKTALDSFNSSYTTEQRKIIYAINRIDERKVWAGKEVIIPDSISSNLMDYAPFPKEFALVDSIPKLVLISQRIQAFALYEKGRLIKWGPVSSGKKSTPTPNGLHYGNYKAKRKVSSVDESWILPYYFNFMNYEGVGTHQYSMPGYPASHACVRLYMEDAQYIYDWASMWTLENEKLKKNGTPFMVFGKYKYGQHKPWFSLVDSVEANDFNEEELQVLRNYMKDYKEDPKNFAELKEAIDSSIS